MQEYVKSPGIRKQYLKVIIKEAWTNLMGPMVVKYTKSLALKKGKLHINVTSAPLRQELLINKIKIIQNMNEAIGEQLIEDISVL